MKQAWLRNNSKIKHKVEEKQGNSFHLAARYTEICRGAEREDMESKDKWALQRKVGCYRGGQYFCKVTGCSQWKAVNITVY
jgi:hypothetical protein